MDVLQLKAVAIHLLEYFCFEFFSEKKLYNIYITSLCFASAIKTLIKEDLNIVSQMHTGQEFQKFNLEYLLYVQHEGPP